jgi:hypothetical protein
MPSANREKNEDEKQSVIIVSKLLFKENVERENFTRKREYY